MYHDILSTTNGNGIHCVDAHGIRSDVFNIQDETYSPPREHPNVRKEGATDEVKSKAKKRRKSKASSQREYPSIDEVHFFERSSYTLN